MPLEPLSPGRREWLVMTYLAYVGRTQPLSRAERLRENSTQGFRAWSMVNELVDDNPEAAWSILLELMARARTRHQLGMIAAGPLESFIDAHWETWIDRVEQRAASDPRLRYCLSRMYVSALPEAYQARVKRLADASPLSDIE